MAFYILELANKKILKWNVPKQSKQITPGFNISNRLSFKKGSKDINFQKIQTDIEREE